MALEAGKSGLARAGRPSACGVVRIPEGPGFGQPAADQIVQGPVQRRVIRRTQERTSAAFSSSVMGLPGHVRPVKPGVALMWSMLDVQAARSAALCRTSSGSMMKRSLRNPSGTAKSSGTSGSAVTPATLRPGAGAGYLSAMRSPPMSAMISSLPPSART